MTLRKLIAGNWKMHGSVAAIAELDIIADAARGLPIDVAVFPPFTLIAAAVARNTGLAIGAQDAHMAAHGAHTGCVSATMLHDIGATMCIVGHSERRANHFESDADVLAKAQAVQSVGLTAIICVGEQLADRQAGDAVAVVEQQLRSSLPALRDRLVVAYEPVWAIGTGYTPSPADVETMHAGIRGIVGPTVRILYGGSVKPSNAAELLRVPHVDGALVGGASLTAAEFVPIIRAAVETACHLG